MVVKCLQAGTGTIEMHFSCKALCCVIKESFVRWIFISLLLLENAPVPIHASSASLEQGKLLRRSSGWLIPTWADGTDPCDLERPWEGITCTGDTISSLNLTNRNLEGALPSQLFSALPDLTHLLLGGNRLKGSIPDSLFELRLLTQLDLSYNLLNGPLSTSLSNLANLEVLSLTGNKFDNSLNVDFTPLIKLQFLLLGGNGLQGPFPSGIVHLNSLEILDLEFNNFAASIPSSIWDLQNLTALGFQGNNFMLDLTSANIQMFDKLEYFSVPPAVVKQAPVYVRDFLKRSHIHAMCEVTPKWVRCLPLGRSHRRGLSVGAIIGITLGFTIFFSITIFSLAAFAYRNWQRDTSDDSTTWLRKERGPSSSDPTSASCGSPDIRGARSGQVFTYRELQNATNNFDKAKMIGEGGFGRVYRAMLSSGRVVAIKKMDDQMSGERGEREFRIEVDVLSRLNHQNLVRLLGYCADRSHRLIVYEYLPHGSLHDYFQAKQADVFGGKLEMHKRLMIAYGSAKALAYLHSGGGLAGGPIIHRDFKASNVLLDGGLQARVSDFGLARLIPDTHRTHVSTRVIGTFGYLDPEYTATGQLTTKSDVYAFGVVLLQLLTGRPTVLFAEDGTPEGIVSWATPFLTDRKKLVEILDTDLGDYSPRSTIKLAKLANVCVKESAKDRPTMHQCVKVLEGILLEANSIRQRRSSFRRLITFNKYVV